MLVHILVEYLPEDHPLIEALFRKYFGTLKTAAYRILKDEYDAEDCAVEVFVRLAPHMEMFRTRTEAQQKCYLLSSCRHIACNVYKRKQNANNPSAISLDDEDLPEWMLEDFSQDLAASYIRKEYVEELNEKIQGMPPIYRDLLYAKSCLELSNKELASTLGVTEAVISMRLSRARAFLLGKKKGNKHGKQGD